MSEERPKRMALIASQGTLDWAYPPFILASTAVAMEMEVGVFFTFYFCCCQIGCGIGYVYDCRTHGCCGI